MPPSFLESQDKRRVGKQVKDVLKPDYYGVFQSMLQQMRQHNAESIQKELRLDLRGPVHSVANDPPLLTDESQKRSGSGRVRRLIAGVGAQRAAAWTEVADGSLMRS